MAFVSTAIAMIAAAGAAAGSSEESRKSASKTASKGRRLALLQMARQPEPSSTVRGSGTSARRRTLGQRGSREESIRAGIANALKIRLGN